MRLLIVTQVVDENDLVLGFFVNWIKHFSKYFEKVIVICLKKGVCDLPSNVEVYSLGKENFLNRSSRLIKRTKYVWNFLRLIISLRKEYDSVFIHMNQEYVLLGGFWWKIFGKKVFLWRNHSAGDFNTDIAISLSDKVFSTSKFSYTVKSHKNIAMPVGIDLEIFKSDSGTKRVPNSILFLGRIAPIKGLHLILEAINILKNKNISFIFNIYGEAKRGDESYLSDLKQYVLKNNLEDIVHFYGGLPNRLTNQIYASSEIFVNVTCDGSYDKTIFEAMASGAIVVTSNKNLKDDINDLFVDGAEPNKLADKIYQVLLLSEKDKMDFREKLKNIVIKYHSLDSLSLKLFNEIKNLE